MKEIKVCVGSSCHLKGAPEIVDILKGLLKKHHLEAEIELGASFCCGRCTEGVIVNFDGDTVKNVTPDNIEDIFYKQLKGAE